jgi:D-tyrosyl-tRNA(Tyr) deacylase
MRVVLQRVARASVTVDGSAVSRIGRGFLLLVGVGHDDGPGDADRLAAKIATLRVFPDGGGTMNLSLADVDGGALVVSQFTLYGVLRKGRRPSWAGAAGPETAAPLVEALAAGLEARGVEVARGAFGADMQVELVNDGPVTLMLDSSTL